MATQYTAGLTTGQVLTAATMNSIGAAWETWTPTVTQLGTVTVTNNFARYARIQKLVVATTYLTVTGTGTTNNAVIVSLPITCASVSSQIVGTGFIYDGNTANMYTVVAAIESTTTAGFYYTNPSGSFFGQSPNIALAVGDQLRFLFTYEAA
jgi:hypothetical protein